MSAPDTGAPEALAPYSIRMWVIPNGAGGLWTPKLFESEGAAQQYVRKFWARANWTSPKHRPVLADVTISAIPAPAEPSR